MKRKDFMKLGVMFVCFSLAAGVPVFAAEQQPATKWQYTQKQEQDGILCVFDELKLKLPETWNGKFVTGVESGAITFYHKDSLNAGKKVRECYVHASFFLVKQYFQKICPEGTRIDMNQVEDRRGNVEYVIIPLKFEKYRKSDGTQLIYKRFAGQENILHLAGAL